MVGMRSFLNDCATDLYRTIRVFANLDSLGRTDTLVMDGDIVSATLWPNPHTSYFDVAIDLRAPMPATVFLFDDRGVEIDRQIFEGDRIAFRHESPLANGTYSLVVRTSNHVVFLRHIRVN